MKIKNGKLKTTGILACINNCKGIIIDTRITQPEREELMNVIMEFMEDPYYNVYGIQSKPSEQHPQTILENQAFVYRFGWFITRDKMDFHDATEIRLTRTNTSYYECIVYGTSVELEDFDLYEQIKPITVSHFVNDEQLIYEAMNKSNH